MTDHRRDKLKPQEYEEAKPEPKETKSDKWGLGQPAPKTKYLDTANGEVVEKQPIRGKVIVFEGDMITQSILAQLDQK